MYFENLCKLFSELEEVIAIALGGSRAGEVYDEKSDYDLYIYCTNVPAEEERKRILEECCSYMEKGNAFWELEDDCTLKDGIDIDILYRNLNDFAAGMKWTVEKCNSGNGYTTCMWHNLLNSKIIYDPNGDFKKLQDQYRVPYPQELKKNIVERNMKLLQGYLPSYQGQILKASRRKDLVSVNHRVAAFMESYFDIIFAANELTHPGEKRMVEYAVKHAKKLPADFEANIEKLFADMYGETRQVEADLEQIVAELKAVL